MSSDVMAQALREDVLIGESDVISHDLVAKRSPSPHRVNDGVQIKQAKNQPCDRSMSLHVSKLRGISFDVRAKLKRNGVTYTHQLLTAAGNSDKRHQFSETSGIEEMTLTRLTCRADLARITTPGREDVKHTNDSLGRERREFGEAQVTVKPNRPWT